MCVPAHDAPASPTPLHSGTSDPSKERPCRPPPTAHPHDCAWPWPRPPSGRTPLMSSAFQDAGAEVRRADATGPCRRRRRHPVPRGDALLPRQASTVARPRPGDRSRLDQVRLGVVGSARSTGSVPPPARWDCGPFSVPSNRTRPIRRRGPRAVSWSSTPPAPSSPGTTNGCCPAASRPTCTRPDRGRGHRRPGRADRAGVRVGGVVPPGVQRLREAGRRLRPVLHRRSRESRPKRTPWRPRPGPTRCRTASGSATRCRATRPRTRRPASSRPAEPGRRGARAR